MRRTSVTTATDRATGRASADDLLIELRESVEDRGLLPGLDLSHLYEDLEKDLLLERSEETLIEHPQEAPLLKETLLCRRRPTKHQAENHRVLGLINNLGIIILLMDE